MSKPKRNQSSKHHPSKGRKGKNYYAFFKRHLATIDLIASSLVAIVFIPLITLYVIGVFSSYSRAAEISSSGVVQAQPVVSAASSQTPNLPFKDPEQQLTSPQTNKPPLDTSNIAYPLANSSDAAEPISKSNSEVVSHTPDFIEEQVATNHPFDAASAVSQAQAVGQPSFGVSPTDFGFTGQRQESFGLMDYGGRYYNPALGRFISADPIVPEPGNPQALNRYSYVYNNPVKYTDPTGHCTEWEGSSNGLCTRSRADGSLSAIVRGGSVFVNDVEKNYANAILSGNPDYMNQIPTDTPGMFLSQSFQNVESQLGYREGEMPADPYVAIRMSAPFGSLAEDGISSGSFFQKGGGNGQVWYPRGPGASEGPVPKGYVPVSRWATEAEAKLWMGTSGTTIPKEVGTLDLQGVQRVYVTTPGAPKPGGTGPIRIDFSVPEQMLHPGGNAQWRQIIQPAQNTPIYNVKISFPPQ